VWSQHSASLDFGRQPYFYETRLFYGFCAGTVCLAIFGAHLLRVRALRVRFRLALQERSRLARELHDTLLQGFAGVVYFLAAASRRADRGAEIDKEQLRRTVEHADQSLKEAREAIACMRMAALQNNTLPQALIEVGKQIVRGTPILFKAEVRGTERELRYETRANLYSIAREAMNNAMAHAHPREIFLALTYGAHSVDLLVHDDGDGFDPGAVPTKMNHWGLVGIRERARQIGAAVEITASPGHGTTVQVTGGTNLSWATFCGKRRANEARQTLSVSLQAAERRIDRVPQSVRPCNAHLTEDNAAGPIDHICGGVTVHEVRGCDGGFRVKQQ